MTAIINIFEIFAAITSDFWFGGHQPVVTRCPKKIQTVSAKLHTTLDMSDALCPLANAWAANPKATEDHATTAFCSRESTASEAEMLLPFGHRYQKKPGHDILQVGAHRF
jgi:hypothetical protein